MNKVILIGRLTKDLDVRYTQGENTTAIARFSLAVDRKRKNENVTADFINCVAFGKTAEFMEKYMSSKGTKVVLEGRIETGNYTDKDGNKVYTTNVIAENVEFGESKKESAQPTPATADGFMDIPDGIDEELPFQ